VYNLIKIGQNNNLSRSDDYIKTSLLLQDNQNCMR